MIFFISPPFGNYLNLPNTISIKGSYTLDPRPGLIGQIFKTLRYSFEYGGWINKIGLRNKGLDYAIKNYNHNHIVSIAILNTKQIDIINNKIPDDMNIEINVSCPNINKKLVSDGISVFLNKKRKWCIIKLSPTTDNKLIDSYYEKGFRQFHCSNTLPVKNGGLSGPILKKYNLSLIKYIKNKYPNSTIIAGGGIRNIKDIEYYKNIGADHFSVSTLAFNPLLFCYFYFNYLQIKY